MDAFNNFIGETFWRARNGVNDNCHENIENAGVGRRGRCFANIN